MPPRKKSKSSKKASRRKRSNNGKRQTKKKLTASQQRALQRLPKNELRKLAILGGFGAPDAHETKQDIVQELSRSAKIANFIKTHGITVASISAGIIGAAVAGRHLAKRMSKATTQSKSLEQVEEGLP
jgi:hypothetical protein